MGGDYQLQTCSPCVNTGSNETFTTADSLDLDRNTRIYDGVVDMGAYESQDRCIVILSGSVTITGNALFGETLTADTTNLTSIPIISNLGTLTYQWKKGDIEMGTNSATYLLTQDDIGNTITVTITAANCDGSVTSEPTTTIAKATQVAPNAPTLMSKTTDRKSVV